MPKKYVLNVATTAQMMFHPKIEKKVLDHTGTLNSFTKLDMPTQSTRLAGGK